MPRDTSFTVNSVIDSLNGLIDTSRKCDIPSCIIESLERCLHELRDKIARGQIDRRNRGRSCDGTFIVGDERHEVHIENIIGDSVVFSSPRWVKEGEVVCLEYEVEDERHPLLSPTRIARVCIVSQCRTGSRDNDFDGLHLVVTKALSRSLKNTFPPSC